MEHKKLLKFPQNIETIELKELLVKHPKDYFIDFQAILIQLFV